MCYKYNNKRSERTARCEMMMADVSCWRKGVDVDER